MREFFVIKPWMGLFGLLGFLGFIPSQNGEPQYFLCLFFMFFSFYFWAKLNAEQVDERLAYNQGRALRIIAVFFSLLSFSLLFFLQKEHISRNLILLAGSLAYAAISILAPALVLYFDQVEG